MEGYIFLEFASLVPVANSQEELRLVDDAFAKICQAIGDLSVSVRKLAAELLGSMNHVYPHFLEQTLDKKLMSDMRVSFIKLCKPCGLVELSMISHCR